MRSAKMQLSDTIIERIAGEGPLSFHDYMQMCLYYPGSGYYTSPRDKIGPGGDFYTTSTLTPVFGTMIGRQLEEMWEITGKREFTIVEYGAGTGMLCRDILQYLTGNPAFYERVRYCIIEKSPVMTQKAKHHLSERVTWINSIGEIAPFTGCVLSNELLDNFPVHQVEMKDQLMEIFVNYRDGFIEELRPAGKELIHYLEELNITLPRGFHTEINLQALQWLKEIADSLASGFVITIDYGYTSSDLYCDRRRNGTLICYHKHRVNDHPYDNIGDQDITAHINFSALSHWGVKYGMNTHGLISQAAFFAALGFQDYLGQLLSDTKDQYTAFKRFAFIKRTLLLDIGQKFKVLIQSKGVPAARLKCFQAKNT